MADSMSLYVSEVTKMANREGDAQFEAMLLYAFTYINRLLETGAGSIFPELQGIDFINPYHVRHAHFTHNVDNDAYILDTSGKVSFLSGSSSYIKRFVKMLDFSISASAPDNYKPLTQVSYTELIREYGIPAYKSYSPSSNARRGRPEKYCLLPYTPETGSNVDVTSNLYLYVSPLPDSTVSYYYTYSYVLGDYWGTYSTASSHTEFPTLLSAFPQAFIFGVLWYMSHHYDEIDRNKYRELFIMGIRQIADFCNSFDRTFNAPQFVSPYNGGII